jgi:hypothetical protein
MTNTTTGASPGRNFLVRGSDSQLPTEALQDSRYQGVASDGSVGGYFPALPLGYKMETYDGRVFRFVENASAVAFVEGNTLIQISDVTMTAASTDATGTIITGTAPAATQYLNEHAGSYAYISVGTGEGVSRRIMSNSASVLSATGMTLTLERSIGASLSTLTIIIHSPWRMRLSDASSPVAPMVASGISQNIAGISFGAVPAVTGSGMFVSGGVSYFGWMQTKGFCEKVLLTASAVVSASGLLSGGLVGSATTDGLADSVAAGATPDDVRIFGYAASGTGSYDVGVMANLFCE